MGERSLTSVPSPARAGEGRRRGGEGHPTQGLEAVEESSGTIIPSEARNLALFFGLYVPGPERDSSLRSE